MSRLTNYPFYTTLTFVHDMYGLEISEDQFETAALVAWHNIGNRNTRVYKTKIYPSPDGTNQWSAPVPCNATIIESITTNYEDVELTHYASGFPSSAKSFVEHGTEMMKFDTPPFYQSGALVNFEQVGDMLYFQEPFAELNVLYYGIYADEEGLPYLNIKEVEAIAIYCAYNYYFKKALQTMDANTLRMAGELKLLWNQKCNAARVPEYLTQNEMDAILDANTSWDRKQYGISFKPRQT